MIEGFGSGSVPLTDTDPDPDPGGPQTSGSLALVSRNGCKRTVPYTVYSNCEEPNHNMQTTMEDCFFRWGAL